MTKRATSSKQRTQKDPFRSEHAKWAALMRRDQLADGVFYFAVITTGIYCRPTCPARRPNHTNTTFYATPQAAEQAGFRPCRRCNPRDAALIKRDTSLVATACRRIQDDQTAPSLADLAAEADLSPYHFQRIFKKITGLSPKAFAKAQRETRLRETLTAPRNALAKSTKRPTNNNSITQHAADAGFSSNARLYATASKALGMLPKTAKSGGTGVTLYYAFATCSLGTLLVAATTLGLAAILFGDTEESLVTELAERFPNAKRQPAAPSFTSIIEAVTAFVEAPYHAFDLPLDLRGTAFQYRVWQALRDVPPGDTISYTELAQRIGEPKSQRAVARACATNNLAVAIPCHRVLRQDGALSGYRWGIERKKTLLKRESKVRMPR